MSVYSFYIFDRHSMSRDPFLPNLNLAANRFPKLAWARGLTRRRAADCIYSKRWNQQALPNLATAINGDATTNPTPLPPSARRTAKDANDAKLIFGAIFSLRRLVQQLGGREDQFLSYRTGEYKLHYFETPVSPFSPDRSDYSSPLL